MQSFSRLMTLALTFQRMQFDVNFCFAIDLVTAGAAGHEYQKLDCEATVQDPASSAYGTRGHFVAVSAFTW